MPDLGLTLQTMALVAMVCKVLHVFRKQFNEIIFIHNV